MVKTKKVKVHKKLVKMLKRTRTIQETIEQGEKYLGNSPSPSNIPSPPKPKIKRTKTIEETIKTGSLYLSQKNPSNQNPSSSNAKKNPTQSQSKSK